MNKKAIREIRLANIVGLDTKNTQHSVAIDEALLGVKDTEAFLEFCRDKKNGIAYESKAERLMTLAHQYKKMESGAMLPHNTATSFSTKLTQKVENARIFIKNQIDLGNKRPFSSLVVDKKPYFSAKELNALSQLGSSSYLITLCESYRLKEELTHIFLSKYIKKAKYASLEDNQKKILSLAKNISKGVA